MPRRGSAPPFSPCPVSRIASRRFAPPPLVLASSARCDPPCVATSRQVRRFRAITGRSSGTRAFPMRCAIVSPCRPIVRPIGIQHRRTRRQLRRLSGPDRCPARSHRRRYRSRRWPVAFDRASPSRVRFGACAPSPDACPAHVRSRCAEPSSPRAAPSCDPSASTADASAVRRVTPSDPTPPACVSLWSRLLPDERSHRRSVLTDRVPQRTLWRRQPGWALTVSIPVICPCQRRSRFGSHTPRIGDAWTNSCRHEGSGLDSRRQMHDKPAKTLLDRLSCLLA